MILKKPTYDVESSQLLLETAAVVAAVLFPAARVPVLVLTSLSVLCKWAGNGKKVEFRHSTSLSFLYR